MRAFRERVKREHIRNIVRWVQLDQWEKIRMAQVPCDPEAEGKTVAALAAHRMTEPWDVIFDILAEAGERYSSVVQLSHTLDWEDILLTLSDPGCSIASDAVTLARQGPLAHVAIHPGSYGFVPRAFQELCVERKMMSFEEVVRRLTSLPAGQLGIWDRGTIRPGMAADLVMIDRHAFRDNTTWTDFNARPDGIELVLVNGKVAVRDGRAQGARGGRVLRIQGGGL
jgi:N-acyl-D-aspartate/D-glutamate deacylase